MNEILKPIFEWLTGNYNLFNNVLYNYVAMTIVGLLAFMVACKFVGSLYDIDLISGRTVGSIIHWVVRLVAFVVIFSVISVIIWFVKLILSIPVWVWWALLVITIFVIICFIVRHFLKKDGKRE